MLQLNEYVYQVHKPAGRPSVEIVFFHGLQHEEFKDAYWTTWLSANGSELWLSWLLRDFPKARILLISFDAFAKETDDQGRMDMYLTGENLVQSLTERDARVGGDGCPVILVAHSIGGLVAKELCSRLHSTISPRQPVRDLLQNIKGLFFYGCPHHGSRFADVSSGFKKGPLFECITTLNTEAQRRNEEFRKLRHKDGWKTYGIAEGRPTILVSSSPSDKITSCNY
jgi:triacylglycerol esterase/lipase EstA (alpha/beta hydrolase family)